MDKAYSVVINRPPHRVFAYGTDPANITFLGLVH